MNRTRARATSRRIGYTLLELMLALALLGALMSVAWAIMGTYRDAEQRGWKLSHRTQVMRSAREWLQGDLQQIAPVKADFWGDAMGFSVTIAPPLDPLPFFEQLMSQSQATDSALPTLFNTDTEPLASMDPMADVSQPSIPSLAQSPWPADQIVVDYRLVPTAPPSASASQSSGRAITSIANDEQFTLVRRERMALASPSSENGIALDQATDNSSAANRLLTAQALYRQTDERQASGGAILRESKLTGITNVRFKYCDGVSWLASWEAGSTAKCQPLSRSVSTSRRRPLWSARLVITTATLVTNCRQMVFLMTCHFRMRHWLLKQLPR